METDFRSLSEAAGSGAAAMNDLLTRYAEASAEVDRIEETLKAAKARLGAIEEVCIDAIQASGSPRHHAAGRSWRVDLVPRVSVPADKRDAVLAKAKELGILHLVLGVNTSGLKSWCAEQAKQADGPSLDARGNPSIVAGTPFEGLASCYMQPALRSVSSGARS